MSGKKDYKDFDASKTPLEGSNLIEASAGTGKTYSIAILVLRLVLEQQLPVKQVLMVTFTRAAVAELEERIRLFVRTAHKASLGSTVKDLNIQQLVQQAIKKTGADKVQQQLKDAVALLDELSVLTIHSFCQQTLNEFAFETNQLFGADMLPDTSSVVEEELNKFWRRYITTMDTALLRNIWTEDMRDNILQLLQEHLGGKKYLSFDETQSYAITPALQQQWIKKLGALVEKETALGLDLYAYITTHTARLKALCEGNTYAKKGLPELLASPAAFLEELDNRKKSAYIGKLFPDVLERVEALAPIREERVRLEEQIRVQVNCLAIKEVEEGLRIFKERNNLLGYDDLIKDLHYALVGRDNERLAEALQQKYKAVFVDEFQDTDRQQFEIFDRAFGKNTVLFYIGDPKQSIYAWRKADIFTYFRARNSVERLYSMNHNYRSSAPMIRAMNRFFLPAEGFDTFYFREEAERIDYKDVDSPGEHRGVIMRGKKEEAPISVMKFPNKDDLLNAVAAQTAQLLQKDGYAIGPKGKRRAVYPSDIGILVRTGRQGSDVKAALARLGIPAVTIDDARVLQSEEARYLLYLVEAVAEPDRSSINCALLSPFTGFRAADILALDDEAVLSRFTRYKSRWQQDGIYTALMDFVADFGVRRVLLQSHSENGERVITNLFQLAELVHQVESRKNLSMPELISWLRRGIDGMATDGDEYMQRVESDEEAVKIVTIHKSKGLEYKIVLAPFLDFVNMPRQEFVSFRDPASGDYTSVEKSRLTKEQQAWYWEQAEQENRRLLYVAITRAVYKCYVFRSEASYSKNSTLAVFLKALEAAPPPQDLIAFEPGAPALPKERWQPVPVTELSAPTAPVVFQLLEENWRKMSYTMLAGKPEITPRLRAFPQSDPYETFVFSTLRRGAKTGNFLHFLFEKVHFDNESKWEFWINEGIRRFVPGQQEVYLPMLQCMLQEVLHTEIRVGGHAFTLSSVAWNKRIPEFEFDFPVPLFIPDTINGFSDAGSSILVKGPQELAARELEGIMNGKIDLFFEQEGRYYVLDWKSNYLGPTPEHYSPPALAVAMNESNYHLQYLIYTLAVRKYLESRIPGFDYHTQFGGIIYLFVRGIRTGSANGIFTAKPPLEKIMALEKVIG